MGQEALQEEVEETVIEEGSQVADDESSEGAGNEESGAGESKAKITYSDEQQEHLNGLISEKVGETYAERQKNEALQRENDELKAKIPKTTRPEVPDLPDKFDEDFEAKMATRDKALIGQQEFDAAERQQSDDDLAAQEESTRQTVEAFNTASKNYSDRSVKLGIKPEDLLKAGQSIQMAGLPLETIAFILDEATGPQITVYLSKNPGALSELAGMSPMNAAVKIASEIKGLAAKGVKQTELPDDPAESLTGQGSQEGLRGPKDATFE